MEANRKEFVTLIKQWAEEKKAEEILDIDVTGKSQFADYMVICHGTNDLHVKAIAQNIIEGSEARGEKPFATEGMENSTWVLIDFIDVIVHIFNRETRSYYRLEELWDINSKNKNTMSDENDKAKNNR